MESKEDCCNHPSEQRNKGVDSLQSTGVQSNKTIFFVVDGSVYKPSGNVLDKDCQSLEKYFLMAMGKGYALRRNEYEKKKRKSS